MEKQSKSVSEFIAEFVCGFSSGEVPQDVIDHAKLCIIDAVGVAFASRTYDFSKTVLMTMSELGGAGDSPVIGEAKKLPIRDAIFANAALIHGLDYDDTHLDSVVHCTASVWPVAFNVGLATARSGVDVLTAYVLGTEVIARIGKLAEGRLQTLGYHPTGIIGAFGCVVTAAYLHRLNIKQTTNALGIILSMASGNMEFVSDGAWTKRIHPAWAGVAALTAVSLAKNGFIGPKKPFEGRYGLFNVILNLDAPTNVLSLADDLGQQWETLNNAIKPYPACHFNHAFADCALLLKIEHQIESTSIERITALIHEDQVDIVCEPLQEKRKPKNPYEAQFSIPYIVASIIVNEQFTLQELFPDALKDPKVLSLSEKVDYAITDKSLYPKHFSGSLIVEMASGERFEKVVKYNRGSRKNPLTLNEITGKYSANCAMSINGRSAEKILKHLMALENSPNMLSLSQLLTTF